MYFLQIRQMLHEFEDSDIENNADDTAPYTCAPDTDTISFNVQSTSDKFHIWKPSLKNAIYC